MATLQVPGQVEVEAVIAAKVVQHHIEPYGMSFTFIWQEREYFWQYSLAEI